jgi:hypothetical protein
MSADPKATAAHVLRLVSASIGLASAPMNSGPYSWIGTLAQAATNAAAELLEAEPISTKEGAQDIEDALTPVFDALPEVRSHEAQVCAEFAVVAVRIVRRWLT